ncbi:hypothetical protein H5968_06235 [Sphaerospermopsis sp. LEGE 00249]|uniref:hypothetical protein n=1 Tax=Sphaerospermopsis sp. LEGE 00249 TaxID=1380707 RepID=UPI00164D5FB0|nr:hypothetical protein [Sphaerospermopsis sp. LEGE 00249]MBC5794754.1 hypothetical protein [Sphaerospermopsis sp. LEGE 00249]
MGRSSGGRKKINITCSLLPSYCHQSPVTSHQSPVPSPQSPIPQKPNKLQR